MKWPRATNGSSLVVAEQLGHCVLVGPCAGTPNGDPFVMRRQGGLDLRFLQRFRRGVPLYRPEPPQLGEWDNGGGLAAEVDHLERLNRIRALGR
jgi:hypothetical protein